MEIRHILMPFAAAALSTCDTLTFDIVVRIAPTSQPISVNIVPNAAKCTAMGQDGAEKRTW